MNPLKYLGAIILILVLMIFPVQAAYLNASCLGVVGSQGNFTFNQTINGSWMCVSGDWFNITGVNTDTNISKNISFDGTKNYSQSVRLIINNTDNSTNYSVIVFNATSAGNVSHNVTVQSNSTGWIQFNLTGLNNTGYINFTKLPGTGTRSASYILSAAFAVIVAGGAAIYLRRIRKV